MKEQASSQPLPYLLTEKKRPFPQAVPAWGFRWRLIFSYPARPTGVVSGAPETLRVGAESLPADHRWPQ